ncbi:LuxR family maltose regulon positive regulatory protein [Kribbella orskensis]|uniref:LuxR family maltose regulon positive regulatory protein n=1 Tax=Kribbella orskensis TaxID=2512216 RepID=A0ABY2B990_9ACTN|nr:MULTISPECIES: LuxR C-terminal-related transcriptional regulator [Kribbella]TCN31677.1 LuxR family maltose regulon positive regulatory protein [Kribbella sp. VKM Ac-2500]TCO12317.1 LuxR family maltose regulon positive regulatory protein [Kribbella orskensis]
MWEGTRPAAPAAVQLDQSLLEAKLSIPQPRQGSVSRAEIIDATRASGCRVVGVTAPAGYGKTILLAQWALVEDRPVGWVSLDRYDDDPAVLLTLLASAYARISPGNAELVADMGGLCVDVLGRAAPRLASAFRSSPEPFVLMVDDLHELHASACHDALGVAISGIPEGSQLVAASRFEQPHLPRLRASGDAVELEAGDLALDEAGAEQIFAEARIGISPELAAAVTERTEGWPVGLYLAALIAGHDRDRGLNVSGDDRYVADYLYRESLMLLPRKTQRFLRRTAVLDQLCAPLCDAVVGESGGQARLRALEASDSFLIPLDRRREWFRYHALYREFLLGELRRIEPEVLVKLHLRAADWYESNGSPALAVEHLLNTTERDRCVQLVTALVLPTYNAGQMSTVQRWLSALGDSAVEGYPPLAVLAGWATALTGQTAAAERWMARVDAASFDQVPVDGTASFDSARAMLRAVMCASGPEQMMVDADAAVAQEPPWSLWLDTALLLSAHARLLTADLDEAQVLFVEAVSIGATLGNTDTVVDGEAELALLAMDRGRWAEAAERVERALVVIDAHRMQDYAVSLLAFAVAARLAVHRGDLDEADRQLARAMRARPSCTFALPFYAVRARLQLAKAYSTRGDQATARHLLREIDELLRHRPALGALVDQVSEVRQTVAANAQSAATRAAPLTGAELRLLPYLQTHLTIGAIGERLFVSRNTVSSEIASIYRKLGVSSRNDAVQQATRLGLLGG